MQETDADSYTPTVQIPVMTVAELEDPSYRPGIYGMKRQS